MDYLERAQQLYMWRDKKISFGVKMFFLRSMYDWMVDLSGHFFFFPLIQWNLWIYVTLDNFVAPLVHVLCTWVAMFIISVKIFLLYTYKKKALKV